MIGASARTSLRGSSPEGSLQAGASMQDLLIVAGLGVNGSAPERKPVRLGTSNYLPPDGSQENSYCSYSLRLTHKT
jgi:hypothetical protein